MEEPKLETAEEEFIRKQSAAAQKTVNTTSSLSSLLLSSLELSDTQVYEP